MEAALQAAQARLRSILETVPDAMIIIDERGRVESLSTTAERLFGYSGGGSGRPEHQDADADAASRAARRLSQALPDDRRAPHHRHRPRRGGPAQGRHDLPDAPDGRRTAVGRQALFHRLHPRPDRPAADRNPAEGAAVGSDAHVALHGAGRDGVDPGARDQPAADGHQQLPQGLPAPARADGKRSRRPCCATRSARRPTRPCGPAISSAACASSWRAARASAASRACQSWSRMPARSP